MDHFLSSKAMVLYYEKQAKILPVKVEIKSLPPKKNLKNWAWYKGWWKIARSTIHFKDLFLTSKVATLNTKKKKYGAVML